MDIITKEQALTQGLKEFYTGIPCKHGHDSPRRVDKGTCVECGKAWAMKVGNGVERPKRQPMTPEEQKEAQRLAVRRYHQKNREAIQAKAKEKIWNDPKRRAKALDWITKNS